ncbi:DUF924 family protein [Caballeronia sp. HLA56]
MKARAEALDSRASAILEFWFGAVGSPEAGTERKLWWKKKPAFDAQISERFGAVLEEAQSGGLREWERTPSGALALIVLLDQFSRNCYRHTPRAFAGDERALALAKALVDSGDDLRLADAYHRAFAYMPFEHDERMESQLRAVELFGKLEQEEGVTSFHESAMKHAEIIERFGRFPHRNRILGRPTTKEEETWLMTRGGF